MAQSVCLILGKSSGNNLTKSKKCDLPNRVEPCRKKRFHKILRVASCQMMSYRVVSCRIVSDCVRWILCNNSQVYFVKYLSNIVNYFTFLYCEKFNEIFCEIIIKHCEKCHKKHCEILIKDCEISIKVSEIMNNDIVK